MDKKITIPENWQLPDSISARIAEVPGTQRCLEADGHLILILHRLPTPGAGERDLSLFWRSPDGAWASDDWGDGIHGLQDHVTEFNERVLKLEETEDSAMSAEEYFEIRHEIAPLYRAAKNMAATISRAYEMCPDDRGLLASRNLAATVERTAELLKEDATYALEHFMAKQAESQALASHRLNVIAAIFFPILAFAAIFGMNLDHGFENKDPWVFWLFVGIGIVIGMAMKSIVFGRNKVRVEKRKNKSD